MILFDRDHRPITAQPGKGGFRRVRRRRYRDCAFHPRSMSGGTLQEAAEISNHAPEPLLANSGRRTLTREELLASFFKIISGDHKSKSPSWIDRG